MTDILASALSVFPERLKTPLSLASGYTGRIYEIRLICKRSVYFYTDHGIRFVDSRGNIGFYPVNDTLKPTENELEEITDRAIGYSGFSREREIKNGYITYAGACRIGICCDGEGQGMGIGKITSLCVRIPCFEAHNADTDFSSLLSFDTGLLVAGAPSTGKTTLLRGITGYLTNGSSGEYKKVCLIDERDEISAGTAMGDSLDIIRGKNKAQAISHAVRLLSPQYIICDEIGSEQETKSLLEGLNSGVRFIASAHAGNLGSLIRRRQFRLLFSENVFDKIVMLSSVNPGKISGVYGVSEVQGEISRTYGSFGSNLHDRDISLIYT